MEQVLFITDGNTSLGKNMVRIFYSLGEKIFSTLQESPEKANTNPKIEYLQWNRQSPISAKNCLLQLKKNMIHGAHFFLLPPAVELLKGEIDDHLGFERAIDCMLKGNYYMIREMISYLNQNQNSSLSLINFSSNTQVPDFYNMLSMALAGMYESFIHKWKDQLLIRAFDVPFDQDENTLDFILKIHEQKGDKSWGKCLRFRKGLRLF